MLMFAVLLGAAASDNTCNLVPIHLTVEHLDDALINPGVDLPRFSWELVAPSGTKSANTVQHRVMVASSAQAMGKPDIWNSGWKETGRNNTIDFASLSPLNLPEASTLYWQAQSAIVDESGKMVPCMESSVHTFRTGVKDWAKAQWLCQSNKQPADDCALYDLSGSNAAPLFRTEFDLAKKYSDKKVVRATAFVTGLGHYKLWVNGEHINAGRYLDPGPASYANRVYYNGFDVTSALGSKDGKVAIGVEVGNGWYNPLPFKFWGHIALRENLLIGPPKTKLRLHLNFEDGTSADVVTSPGSAGAVSWKVDTSALLRNDLYLGNVYDFNRAQELKGWAEPGFDDGSWSVPQLCDVIMPELGALQPQPTPPIKARVDPFTGATRLTPTVTELESGNIVFDMGLNFAGVLELKVTVGSFEEEGGSTDEAAALPKNSVIVNMHRSEGLDLQADSTFEWELQNGLRYNHSTEMLMELKYGEVLWENGTVNPLTGTAGQVKRAGCCGQCAPPIAYQRDLLILPTGSSTNSGSTYEFSPDFTWHGYRFVEVSTSMQHSLLERAAKGSRSPLQMKLEVVGIPIATAVAITGEFSSPKKILNDIHAMATNTHLSNMQGQQSDCPHRERFGYTGDAFATMHTSLMLFDGRTFYEKRIRDVADAQRSTGGITETAPFVGVHDRGLGNASGPIGWDTIFPMMQIALIRHHGNFKGTAAGDTGMRSATEKWMGFLEDPKFNRTGEWPYQGIKGGGAAELGLGDWMPVNNTPTTISGRIFVALNYRSWGQLNSMGAGTLGNSSVAAQYAAKAAKEETAFANRFLDRSSGLLIDRSNHSTPPLMIEHMGHRGPSYGPGYSVGEDELAWEMALDIKDENYGYYYGSYGDKPDHGPTQCAQGMALGYGMVKPTSHATADDPDDATLVYKGLQHMAELSKDHMSAGMFGVEWVLKGLSRGAGVPVPVPGARSNASDALEVDTSGHDRAYAMATATDYPSWGYMLGKNATTIWESWDYSNSTFSHNHPMFSGVVPWMVNVVAGVEIADDAIGGDRLLFAPQPPSGARLRWAKAAIHTPLGRAASSWRCDGKGGMEVNVSVPVNSVGRVVIPSNKPGDSGWLMANVTAGNWSYSTTTVLCDASAY
jgi:hypothetical protein